MMFELTDVYAEQARYFEMKFLSAGLHYPALAYEAAANYRLTTLSFALPSHRPVFGWICELAELGRGMTYEEFCNANGLAGRLFEAPYRQNEFYWFEPWPTGIDRWAERVAALAAVRRRVDEMKQETAEMLREFICQAA